MTENLSQLIITTTLISSQSGPLTIYPVNTRNIIRLNFNAGTRPPIRFGSLTVRESGTLYNTRIKKIVDVIDRGSNVPIQWTINNDGSVTLTSGSDIRQFDISIVLVENLDSCSVFSVGSQDDYVYLIIDEYTGYSIKACPA